jgi:hypothetical protein
MTTSAPNQFAAANSYYASVREATIVAIGIHPFVVGTPDGAEALRRVLENFKNQKPVWVTMFKRYSMLRARNSS